MSVDQNPEGGVIVVIETCNGLQQYLLDGRHRLVADEPDSVGGNDAGPDPYGLLLMALGACTSITLRLYARRKSWPLKKIRVHLRHARVHAEDCRDCDEKPVRLDCIDRVIQLDGALNAEQLAQLLVIAEHCPVHRSLAAGFDVTTRLGPVSALDDGP
ncbi:MAG TPA: OsmC family protein [Rhizomicrobium sp.]|jgi:putative redox protein|nr:OsmC family protein [Rhizomicrobium sp.]